MVPSTEISELIGRLGSGMDQSKLKLGTCRASPGVARGLLKGSVRHTLVDNEQSGCVHRTQEVNPRPDASHQLIVPPVLLGAEKHRADCPDLLLSRS